MNEDSLGFVRTQESVGSREAKGCWALKSGRSLGFSGGKGC